MAGRVRGGDPDPARLRGQLGSRPVRRAGAALQSGVELRLVAEGRSVVGVGARGASGTGGEHTQTLMFGDEGTKLHVRHQGGLSVTGTVVAEVVETYLAASRAKRDLRPDSLWGQTFPVTKTVPSSSPP